MPWNYFYVQENYGFSPRYTDIHNIHSTVDLSQDLTPSILSTINENNASFLTM